MIVGVILPKSGMGIDEGTVVRWLKAVGDRITVGDILAEVETAKALQEVEALVGGTLARILVPEGETVRVNATLAEIQTDLPA